MPATPARVKRAFDLELEEREYGDAPRIVGHAAVFDRLSEDLGGFREEIKPGAFTRTIAGLQGKERDDVIALFNHNENYVLGSTKSGSLKLAEDDRGLLVDVQVDPDNATIRDLVLKPMRRGDINKMSFAFRIVQERWRDPRKDERDKGIDTPVRSVREVKLYDVSVVTYPAYTQTDATVRSALVGVGIDFDSLAAAIERGITPNPADVALLRSSISALSALLPSDPVIPMTTPPADDPTPPAASLALWRQRLLLAERSVLTV